MIQCLRVTREYLDYGPRQLLKKDARVSTLRTRATETSFRNNDSYP
jgi:hypothetical protein